MNESQGERHSLSPEHGFISGSLNLEEVLGAFNFVDSDEAEGDQEPLSDYLENFWMLRRDNGFPSALFHDYKDLKGLDLGQGAGGPFWDDHREMAQSIQAFSETVYQGYVEETAGIVAYFTEFFTEHPTLLRINSADGPYITGIDADFDVRSRHYREGEAAIVLYSDNEEVYYMNYTTKLFITLESLPLADQKRVAEYCRVMEIKPVPHP
jgi:hypothetical protein